MQTDNSTVTQPDPFYTLCCELRAIEQRVAEACDAFECVDAQRAHSVRTMAQGSLSDACCTLGDIEDNYQQYWHDGRWHPEEYEADEHRKRITELMGAARHLDADALKAVTEDAQAMVKQARESEASNVA